MLREYAELAGGVYKTQKEASLFQLLLILSGNKVRYHSQCIEKVVGMREQGYLGETAVTAIIKYLQ